MNHTTPDPSADLLLLALRAKSQYRAVQAALTAEPDRDRRDRLEQALLPLQEPPRACWPSPATSRPTGKDPRPPPRTCSPPAADPASVGARAPTGPAHTSRHRVAIQTPHPHGDGQPKGQGSALASGDSSASTEPRAGRAPARALGVIAQGSEG